MLLNVKRCETRGEQAGALSGCNPAPLLSARLEE
jgi:hypothetical protein